MGIHLYILFTFRRVALFANHEAKTKLEPEVAFKKSFEESNTIKFRILSQIRSYRIKIPQYGFIRTAVNFSVFFSTNGPYLAGLYFDWIF